MTQPPEEGFVAYPEEVLVEDIVALTNCDDREAIRRALRGYRVVPADSTVLTVEDREILQWALGELEDHVNLDRETQERVDQLSAKLSSQHTESDL